LTTFGVGPTSQDFRAAFGLGHDVKTISMVEGDAIALAALQGLHHPMQEKDAKIEAQQRDITELRERMSRLEALLSEIDTIKHSLLRETQFRESDSRTAAGLMFMSPAPAICR